MSKIEGKRKEKNSKQAYKKSIMIGFWENKSCSRFFFSINIGMAEPGRANYVIGST